MASYPETHKLAEKIVPALAKALEDKSSVIRAAACLSMGFIGAKAEIAVPAILDIANRLISDPDILNLKKMPEDMFMDRPDEVVGKVRELHIAIQALGMIGPAAKSTLPRLSDMHGEISNNEKMIPELKKLLKNDLEESLKNIQEGQPETH
jgi:hypothetical protein